MYEVEKVLGKGSYGSVLKACCRNTGRLVALKIMINEAESEYDVI